MAIDPLGRLFNVVPTVHAGGALSLKTAAGVMYVCTGNDTFTLTVADTFAGSYATPGSIITRVWRNTSLTGTAAWTRVTQTAANTVVMGGATTAAFYVDSSSLPDGKVYIKCTASGAGLASAILCDLNVQRDPRNLAIPGA